MKKTRVGIINVTGYVGIELARYLKQHPQVELVSVTGRSAAGKRLAEVFPHLTGLDLTIQAELGDVELAFSAMPHKESAAVVAPLLERGLKVIDLSADFRLHDAAQYPAWYSFEHPQAGLLADAVYGLPELHRPQIAATPLAANPGCFPTAAVLALAPLVKAGLIGEEIIVDAKTGISGAGRGLKLAGHFAEANEDTAAYALEGHRHLPEIIQELAALGGELRVTFVPHLVPMTRGILATCYATPKETTSQEELAQLYRDFYKDEPFVHVAEAPPHTKQTWGSNLCLIYPTVDARTGRLVIISCLDNLGKGAAGQAVQNMNLMLSLPETAGLDMPAVYP
jgi:N-acetyl-gamma-glutamyl-phosphate reductase